MFSVEPLCSTTQSGSTFGSTAKIYFFRIVLDPGVNIKIFSGCVHKKDIYKSLTMGELRPYHLFLGLTLFDTFYHFLPPGFYCTLTIFVVYY